MMPTLETSMAKKEAVMGVPNRAEKAAAMPLIRMIFLSFSFRRNRFPTEVPRDAPICRAALSRPTEPPNRMVMTVETKIRPAILSGMATFVWMLSMMESVP